MSLFITFEGGDGSGKSTQACLLHHRLQELAALKDREIVLVHEPGSTAFGELVAEVLRRKKLLRELYRAWVESDVWTGLNPRAELLLFAASRAQLVSEVIRPNLEKGHILVCDRFTDSTLAYQGHGRGLELRMIETVNEIATSGLHPDLTILLDLDVETGLARVKSSRRTEPFERESIAFHQRVREGYLKMAAADPRRWFVVDATLSQQEIGDLIWERVNTLLYQKGYTSL